MSTEPLNIYEYHTALLEWHRENVGQSQRLYLAQDACTLLSTMRTDILRYAPLLYNRYATVIDMADLSVLQQYAAAKALQAHWRTHEDITGSSDSRPRRL